jgi:hypothetical protein
LKWPCKRKKEWSGALTASAEAVCRRAEQRKGKGRAEEEGAPTGGVPVLVTAGKKKRGKGTRAATVEDVGPVGRLG